MLFKLRLLPLAAATLVIAACGGSSGGGSSSAPTSMVFSGIAVDGYLIGSTVSCNVDGTGLPSVANFTAINVTDSKGRFTFSTGCDKGLIVAGGYSDLGNGTAVPFTGILKAPAGATVISPISTLIANIMRVQNRTAIDAQSLVNAALGYPTVANTDLLNTDPAKLSGTAYANPALLKSNLIVQQLIQTTTANIAALANTPGSTALSAVVASGVATALANSISSPLPSPLISNFDLNTVSISSGVVAALTADAGTAVANSVTTDPALAAAKTALSVPVATSTAPSTLAKLTSPTVATQLQTFATAVASSAASPTAIATATQTAQNNTTVATAITNTVNSGQTTSLTTITTAVLTPAITAAVTNATANPPANTAISIGQVPTSSTSSTIATTTTTTASSTSSTGATTSTTTTTTTSTTLPQNSLYLAGDVISYDNGVATPTSYTLGQFGTGAGIAVQWPMANNAAVKFTLADSGGFSVPSNKTFSAAFSITDTTKSTSADCATDTASRVCAYISGLTITKTGSNITLSIPSSATGQVYFKSTDGTEALCSLATCGGGSATATVSTAPNTVSSIVLGQVVNYAVNHLNSATGMNGKYGVKLVLDGLSLMRAAGTPLTTDSVSVPNGTATPTLITGSALQGFITVTNLTPTTTTTTSTTAAPTTTTTTATVTTTTLPSVLTMGSDTISVIDGTTTAYSLATFQSAAGISLPWPSSNASLQFSLADTSGFIPAAGQTLTAAMSIVDQTSGSVGQIKAFIDNVQITKGANNVLTVTVKPSPSTWFYGLSSDGLTAASTPFSSTVTGMTNGLSTGNNSISLSSLVGAVNSAGNLFPGTGKKYALTLVVTGLDLYPAGSTTLYPLTTVVVPTSISGTSSRTITGRGITGFVTLN